MNPENITEQCKGCPNIEPYVLDINRIRSKIVELLVLQADLDEPYEDFTFKLNRLTDSLEESQQALKEVYAITTGCPGVEKEGDQNTCQSPLNSKEISDDIF